MLAEFHRLAALLIFLQLDVHHWLLRGWRTVLPICPPGGALTNFAAASGLLHAAGGILLAGVQIAAPVLAATLVADVALWDFWAKPRRSCRCCSSALAVKNLLGPGDAGRRWCRSGRRFFAALCASRLRLGKQLLHLTH